MAHLCLRHYKQMSVCQSCSAPIHSFNGDSELEGFEYDDWYNQDSKSAIMHYFDALPPLATGSLAEVIKIVVPCLTSADTRRQVAGLLKLSLDCLRSEDFDSDKGVTLFSQLGLVDVLFGFLDRTDELELPTLAISILTHLRHPKYQRLSFDFERVKSKCWSVFSKNIDHDALWRSCLICTALKEVWSEDDSALFCHKDFVTKLISRIAKPRRIDPYFVEVVLLTFCLVLKAKPGLTNVASTIVPHLPLLLRTYNKQVTWVLVVLLHYLMGCGPHMVSLILDQHILPRLVQVYEKFADDTQRETVATLLGLFLDCADGRVFILGDLLMPILVKQFESTDGSMKAAAWLLQKVIQKCPKSLGELKPNSFGDRIIRTLGKNFETQRGYCTHVVLAFTAIQDAPHLRHLMRVTDHDWFQAYMLSLTDVDVQRVGVEQLSKQGGRVMYLAFGGHPSIDGESVNDDHLFPDLPPTIRSERAGGKHACRAATKSSPAGGKSAHRATQSQQQASSDTATKPESLPSKNALKKKKRQEKAKARAASAALANVSPSTPSSLSVSSVPSTTQAPSGSGASSSSTTASSAVVSPPPASQDNRPAQPASTSTPADRNVAAAIARLQQTDTSLSGFFGRLGLGSF